MFFFFKSVSFQVSSLSSATKIQNRRERDLVQNPFGSQQHTCSCSRKKLECFLCSCAPKITSKMQLFNESYTTSLHFMQTTQRNLLFLVHKNRRIHANSRRTKAVLMRQTGLILDSVTSLLFLCL
ncbi:Hypothetical predicted protein [Xyrichtys novacula]|uniref:Uncharacterized protein n=1 Tax=Xyrichtys novacula TaxID=13765 RepID=A0AAV1H1Y4_XYRNO|nr:Hypothetical predicted protein [Xyrichtys novacula]